MENHFSVEAELSGQCKEASKEQSLTKKVVLDENMSISFTLSHVSPFDQ